MNSYLIAGGSNQTYVIHIYTGGGNVWCDIAKYMDPGEVGV